MTEYIERENAIAWFMPYAHAGESIDADVVISDIKGMKAADVAPVRHGRWNADETCPFCGEKSTEGLDAEKWNYWFPDFCPNCGCRMDLSEGGTHDT